MLFSYIINHIDDLALILNSFCMQQEIRRNPLYMQVAVAIEKKLQKKLWNIEKPLPAEPELGQLFGVSIGTVRKAVDSLVDRGLLIRRQGAGTFIRRYAESGYWNRFQRFQSSNRRIIRWRGELLVLERCPANDEVAAALHIKEGQEVLHSVRRMRSADDSLNLPSCQGWDQSWLVLPAFGTLTAQDYAQYQDLSLYEMYEKASGVVILDVRDELSVLDEIRYPLDRDARPLHGPFYKLQRQARTFGGETVEYRVATPRCEGLCVVLAD